MMVMVMVLMTFMMPVEDDSEGDYNDNDINALCLFRKHW